MHNSGTGIHGDVLGQYPENISIEERVPEVHALELAALEARDFPRAFQLAFRDHLWCELCADDVDLATRFERNVLFIRMKCDCHRRRQRPGRGGPYDGEHFLAAQSRINRSGIIHHRVLHPHRRASVVFIFDFCFREGGLVVDTPVHRAQALVDESHEAVLEEVIKRAQNDRFVARRHGRVGMVPAAKHADALELLALQVEKLLRVLAALQPYFRRIQLQLLFAELLVYLDLDGQPVAIPTRDVRCIESRHAFGLHDEILQALVEGVSKVQRTIGVGRPIMQDIAGKALARFLNALINALFFPASQDFRLILWQIRLHGEVGFGQIQRMFQLERHSGIFS